MSLIYSLKGQRDNDDETTETTKQNNAGVRMGFLFWLRRLYSLDTLDTRFTTPSTTPLKVAAESLPERNELRAERAGAGPRTGAGGNGNGASPPRWRSPEFILYYAILSVAVPMMFKSAIEVSQGRRSYPRIMAPGSG